MVVEEKHLGLEENLVKEVAELRAPHILGGGCCKSVQVWHKEWYLKGLGNITNEDGSLHFDVVESWELKTTVGTRHIGGCVNGVCSLYRG